MLIGISIGGVRLLHTCATQTVPPCEMACARRCTTPDTTNGRFIGHAFVPDSGCYHAVPSIAETFALLRGRWLLTTGGSNAWATHNALARQLDPTAFPWRDERYDGSGAVWPLFADQIWERQDDGSHVLLHSAYVCTPEKPCAAGVSAWHVQHDSLSAAQSSLTIPLFSDQRHVRLTFGLGRLYPAANSHLDHLRYPSVGGWEGAPKLVYVQVGIWYLNELEGVPAAQMPPEREAFLANQTTLCEAAGMRMRTCTI